MSRKKENEEIGEHLPIPDNNPTPRNTLVDIVQESELNEEDIASLDSSFDRKLNEWVQLNCTEDIVPLVYLYKFDHPTNGEAKSLICKYDNEIPDAHTIGLQFGSGRYWISVVIPKTRNAKSSLIRGYRFRIHPEYDKLRGLSAVSSGNPLPTVQKVVQSPSERYNAMNEGLSMVKEVMALIIPLLAVNRQESSGSNMPDMAKFMMQQYSQMGEIMKHNILESGKLLADGQRMKIEAQHYEESDSMVETEQKSIIEQVLPYLGQFLPLLLGNSPQSVAVAKTVQALPQFAQVKNNPAELKALVSHLDKAKGREVTDKLLSRLKIKRPA